MLQWPYLHSLPFIRRMNYAFALAFKWQSLCMAIHFSWAHVYTLSLTVKKTWHWAEISILFLICISSRLQVISPLSILITAWLFDFPEETEFSFFSFSIWDYVYSHLRRQCIYWEQAKVFTCRSGSNSVSKLLFHAEWMRNSLLKYLPAGEELDLLFNCRLKVKHIMDYGK